MERYRVIIVGAGPAGLATALHLTKQMPDLAQDLLILEAKTHPRPKLCGGGVTFHGEEQLTRLGVEIDAPAFVVHRIIFRMANRTFTIPFENAMRIFDRAEFDAALARAVEAQGLCLHSDERLLDMHVHETGVELVTNRTRYLTDVVIGADGAKSVVRQKLRLPKSDGVARLLRIMTPVDPDDDTLWQQHAAIFDFACVMQGIQGYTWDFPCYIGGVAHMNRGIFDSRLLPERERGNLKETFMTGLSDRDVDLDKILLEGHPVRWFNPDATFARPRVLLVGDAAGVDPLFAEGISYAMEYGEIATGVIQDAFDRDDYSFTNYRSRLLNHHLGQMLMRRAAIARSLYRHPRLWALLWPLADYSPARVQRMIGAWMALLPPRSST